LGADHHQHCTGALVDHSEINECCWVQIINNTVYLREEEFQFRQASNVALAWEEFLGPAGLGDVPGEIQYFCCGQFAVTRERIMLLPRNFYLQVSSSGRAVHNFKPLTPSCYHSWGADAHWF
jgi:hypothetical protein